MHRIGTNKSKRPSIAPRCQSILPYQSIQLILFFKEVPLLALWCATTKQFRNGNEPPAASETSQQKLHSGNHRIAAKKTAIRSVEEPIVEQHYRSRLEFCHHCVRHCGAIFFLPVAGRDFPRDDTIAHLVDVEPRSEVLMAIGRAKQLTGIRGDRPRAIPDLFASFFLRDHGKGRVIPGMVPNSVPFGRNARDKLSVPLRTHTDHEESRARVMSRQDIEEAGRVDRIRPVVECQRDHWLFREHVGQRF